MFEKNSEEKYFLFAKFRIFLEDLGSIPDEIVNFFYLIFL